MKHLTSSLRTPAMLACLVGLALFYPRVCAADITGLVATAVSSSEVALTWDEADRVGLYSISRTGPDGQTFTIAVTSSLSFRDRALEPDTTYTYTVSVDFPATRRGYPMTVSCHTTAWQNQDIGQVGAGGSVQWTGDVVTVTGSGADIEGSADAFHFAHQPWSGDGVMIVRVNSVANTAPWAKAGIMFRESLAPGSRHVMACMNPKGDGALMARAVTDGPSELGISVYTYTPQWLKLARAGDTFQAFQSRDGVEWTLIGTTTVALPANVYAGLAVTSHSEGTLSPAVFDGFNLSPTWNGSGGTATNVTASASSSRISVTWNNAAQEPAYPLFFLVEFSRESFRTSGTVFSPSVTSTAIHGLEPNTTYYLRVRPIFRDGFGLSSPIIPVTTVPAPPGTTPASPTSLSANAVTSSQVNLMWADNSDNETSFVIESSTDGTLFAEATSVSANNTSVKMQRLSANTTYHFRVRAIHYGGDVGYDTISSGNSNVASATTFLTPTGSPYDVFQPWNNALPLGGTTMLSTSSDGPGPLTFQWQRNGIAVPDSNTPFYEITAAQPSHTGIYTVAVTNAGGTFTTEPSILGLTLNQKVAGGAREVGTDIRHPNGNTYDQVLLEGPAASITADPNQVTRISYVDLNDDIVQVEFAGAGTLTITLDNPSGPAPAQNYLQPDVSYMKGHATIVIAGADATTYVSVFSVGRANAVNQTLFRDNVDYDGVADIALVTIMSPSGRFGGVFTGNAHYFNTRSLTGIFAPNVQFGDRVIASDITANDNATPMLLLGQAADVRIAGGNLAQANSRAVQVGMFSRVQFVAGTTSEGETLPAQTIQGRLEQNGRDVTTAMTLSSAQ